MRPTQQTTYDYSQLILAAKKESQYKDFSSFIDEKIHQTRDRYYDGEAHSFPIGRPPRPISAAMCA